MLPLSKSSGRKSLFASRSEDCGIGEFRPRIWGSGCFRPRICFLARSVCLGARDASPLCLAPRNITRSRSVCLSGTVHTFPAHRPQAELMLLGALLLPAKSLPVSWLLTYRCLTLEGKCPRPGLSLPCSELRPQHSYPQMFVE